MRGDLKKKLCFNNKILMLMLILSHKPRVAYLIILDKFMALQTERCSMQGGLNQIILFGLGFQILASVKEKSFSLLASFII